MLFNDPAFFALFLPAVFLIFHLLNAFRSYQGAVLALVLASLFFYGYWKPEYLPILIGSVLFNFTVGRWLAPGSKLDEGPRKSLLIAGILANVSLLGVYKYADFVIGNVNAVSGSSFHMLELILPLAISFFTFQQIAYLVDSYKGLVKRDSFLNYALFVTFFPQLIAGPIVHHAEMMPQFSDKNRRRLIPANISAGIFIFIIGLSKKVVIADTLAIWANYGFDQTSVLGFYEAWITSLSYTFQLYFDFSGYADMAIGAALLFNIHLPLNFNSPYKATSIQDFWRRWHMTLSRWLRDYIYIPLGGNREGMPRLYTNLFLTFLIGGIWHGAAWTFVAWGALHGAAIVAHRLWQQAGFRMNMVFAWIVTFLFVNTTWVFFRATSFGDALKVLSGMIGLNGTGPQNEFLQTFEQAMGIKITTTLEPFINMALSEVGLLFIFVAILCTFLAPNSTTTGFRQLERPTKLATVLAPLLIFVTYLFAIKADQSPFLYFNF